MLHLYWHIDRKTIPIRNQITHKSYAFWWVFKSLPWLTNKPPSHQLFQRAPQSRKRTSKQTKSDWRKAKKKIWKMLIFKRFFKNRFCWNKNASCCLGPQKKKQLNRRCRFRDMLISEIGNEFHSKFRLKERKNGFWKTKNGIERKKANFFGTLDN